MPTIHCPVCDLEFSPEQRPEALPFCSPRCKRIDQKRWLGEEYGLPYESEDREPVVSD
ncbi:MAG: DNA gyrase inhibitor YacG [Planctomycetaceae bacterium]|nr:DNA gyrase inhibitor YacG [Planctomycetaceae bacterium]